MKKEQISKIQEGKKALPQLARTSKVKERKARPESPHSEKPIAEWKKLTPEERLKQEQFPPWALLTYSSPQHPPQKGFLIPIQGENNSKDDLIFPGISLIVERDTEEMQRGARFIPAITVTINGNYRHTFEDADALFSANALPETDVMNCDVIVTTKARWIQKVWKNNWGKLPRMPRIHDSGWRGSQPCLPVPGPILCKEYFRAPRQRNAKLSPADKKYLVMMLLHDYWQHHPDKDESRNSDLRALKLASDKSDRRNFHTTSARTGIYTINSRIVDYGAWFWRPNPAPKGLSGWGLHAIASENLARHWFT